MIIIYKNNKKSQRKIISIQLALFIHELIHLAYNLQGKNS